MKLISRATVLHVFLTFTAAQVELEWEIPCMEAYSGSSIAVPSQNTSLLFTLHSTFLNQSTTQCQTSFLPATETQTFQPTNFIPCNSNKNLAFKFNTFQSVYNFTLGIQQTVPGTAGEVGESIDGSTPISPAVIPLYICQHFFLGEASDPVLNCLFENPKHPIVVNVTDAAG
ncbi:hypothetical protein MMC09_005922 [Bachmanniomyces sp. S44760]|nr:hypothetical protein [Bachmanniomyces sp. S44760]